MRRAAERFTTVAPARPDADEGWAVTHHSFSFGEHYDPDRVGLGVRHRDLGPRLRERVAALLHDAGHVVAPVGA